MCHLWAQCWALCWFHANEPETDSTSREHSNRDQSEDKRWRAARWWCGGLSWSSHHLHHRLCWQPASVVRAAEALLVSMVLEVTDFIFCVLFCSYHSLFTCCISLCGASRFYKQDKLNKNAGLYNSMYTPMCFLWNPWSAIEKITFYLCS